MSLLKHPLHLNLERLQVLVTFPKRKAASLCKETLVQSLHGATFLSPGRRLCSDDSDQQV